MARKCSKKKSKKKSKNSLHLNIEKKNIIVLCIGIKF